MDEKDLKITALTQRIGELSSEYEERIADLRVAITQQQQLIDSSSDQEEVLEGEVV